MTSTCEELCRLMEKALELIDALSELSDRKAECLTSGDIEGLRSAMENEEEIIGALNDTEKDRMIKADALSQAIGLFSQNLRLKELIAAIPDQVLKERLSRLGERLGATVEDLSQKNGRLSELLQLQIGCNEYMLNMLLAPDNKNNAYDIRGSRRHDDNGLGILDFHV